MARCFFLAITESIAKINQPIFQNNTFASTLMPFTNIMSDPSLETQPCANMDIPNQEAALLLWIRSGWRVDKYCNITYVISVSPSPL